MARRRLDAQMPEAQLTARADVVLCNDGTRDQLRQRPRPWWTGCWPRQKGGLGQRA